jgi:hypothetical protein
MTTYEILTVSVAEGGVLIAGCGLVVSIISLRRSNAIKKVQSRLQEKQEELIDIQLKLHRHESEVLEVQNTASKSADVRVSLEGSATHARFVIRNWGFGPANNVELSVKPISGKESPLVKGDYDKKLPIPCLSPGGECSLIAALTFGTGISFDLTWSWKEENGVRHEESSRVSL